MIKVTIMDPPREDPPEESRTETFELHKGVLVFYSDYFRASLDGDFEEAHNKHIHLSSDDVDFETFRIFRGWLYTRVIHDNGKDGKDLSYTTIVKLWIFADAYWVPMLKNLCLDLFAQRYGKHHIWPSTFQISLIYAASSEDSSIRRFIVDLMASARRRTSGCITSSPSGLPHEFLHDLVKALWFRPPILKPSQWKVKGTCKYHEHPEGVSCGRPASQ